MTNDSSGSMEPSGRIYFNNTSPRRILISGKEHQTRDINYLKNRY